MASKKVLRCKPSRRLLCACTVVSTAVLLALTPGSRLMAGNASGSEIQMVELLRYRLSAADLPQGFEDSGETATPNAALAFSADQLQSMPLLQKLVSSGRVTGLQQTFTSESSS